MPVAADLYYYLNDSGNFSKPPLVLIHGEGGNHLNWHPEIRRLSGARVFSLDLPGHGKSAGIGWQSIPDYARSVVEWMDAARISKALIAGHSMGGAIALEMALKFRNRVSGLGLISTSARLPIPSSTTNNALNSATMPLAIKDLLDLYFSPNTDPDIRSAVAASWAATRPSVFHGDLLACDAYDTTRKLRHIRTPVLVICGTEDRFTPMNDSRVLVARIKGAALQTIDGTAHMPILEQPRRVAGLLNVFLSTLPYSPGAKY